MGITGRVLEQTGQRHSRVKRIAQNEAAFRAANEQIDAVNAAGAQLPVFPIVCECGADDCLLVFPVSAGLYRRVRGHPSRFLVKTGHVAEDVESVVEQHDEFEVVEKHPGEPQRLAEQSDPRAESGVVDEEIARRIAENEARFRDANERIEEAVLRLEPSAQTLPFVGECGRASCLTIIRLTIEQYEAARDDPRYFLCEPGHEMVGNGLGRVVRDMGKFVIVEKIGEAGEIAERRDPRSA